MSQIVILPWSQSYSLCTIQYVRPWQEDLFLQESRSATLEDTWLRDAPEQLQKQVSFGVLCCVSNRIVHNTKWAFRTYFRYITRVRVGIRRRGTLERSSAWQVLHEPESLHNLCPVCGCLNNRVVIITKCVQLVECMVRRRA